MKTRLRSLIILLITLLLLYLVFRKVGLQELLGTLRSAEWFWLAISFALSPLLNLVSVIKWQLLLNSRGTKVPLWRLYALYLVGRFFNYFLPSNVGGDVVRGYELGNYTKNGAEAMASVFMERFTGFVMLVLFAVGSLFTNWRLLQETGLTPAVLFSVVVLVGVLWLVLDRRPLDLVARWFRFPVAQKYISKLLKFHASINAYKHNRRVLVIALFWSMSFMVLAILNVYTSAMAFQRPVSLIEITVIVPIILVVAMFPVTVNGLGLQEWTYVLLFTWLGLPASVGLSTILFIRAKDILFALFGGMIYPFLKVQKGPALARKNAREEAAVDQGPQVIK